MPRSCCAVTSEANCPAESLSSGAFFLAARSSASAAARHRLAAMTQNASHQPIERSHPAGAVAKSDHEPPPTATAGAMATGLPDRATALAAPLRAFPSWHIRIECATCGRERCLDETNLTIAGHGDRRVGDLIRRLKHEGCGGRPKLVELITGIPGGARGSGASCCWSETAPR